MRQPITPSELLTQWELMRLFLLKRHSESAPGSVERSVLEVMDFQLGRCIEELDQVLNGEYPADDLLRIVATRGDV